MFMVAFIGFATQLTDAEPGKSTASLSMPMSKGSGIKSGQGFILGISREFAQG